MYDGHWYLTIFNHQFTLYARIRMPFSSGAAIYWARHWNPRASHGVLVYPVKRQRPRNSVGGHRIYRTRPRKAKAPQILSSLEAPQIHTCPYVPYLPSGSTVSRISNEDIILTSKAMANKSWNFERRPLTRLGLSQLF